MTVIKAEWLDTTATKAVCRALTAGGHHAYFVGGCVRNALMGAPVSDLDIATNAEPATVLALSKAAGLKTIPTGIDHGTVTIVADHVPYEVTTFRRDVSTDGRRATVAFSTDLAEDAARRDFTMNALYAAPDGTVTDPLDGLPDLLARRVRFIGEPDARIREDYLRILRFFRFHAIYGDPENGLDADGLAACAGLAEGLEQISAERIGTEFRKLLSAIDPAPSVAAMAATGILMRVLPGADHKALAPLVHLEATADIQPDWRRRLGALGVSDWQDALRLSKAEQRHMDGIHLSLGNDLPIAVAAYKYGPEVARNSAFCRAAMAEIPLAQNWAVEAERGAKQTFPIRAADLSGRLSPGPALGTALKALERTWIASDFCLTKSELLAIDTDTAL